MPLLIDSLDDQVLVDKTPSFNGGVNSQARPSALTETQLSLLQNADISVEGRIITRRGTEEATDARDNSILGLGYFDINDFAGTKTYDHALLSAASDGSFGRLRIWDGATWQSPIADLDYFMTIPVLMVMGIDRMWIAQAGKRLKYFDGNTVASATVSELGNTDEPYRPAFIEWHTNRLVAAGMGNVSDNLSFSQYGDGTVWNHAQWDTRIGRGDGDPITGIIGWTNFNLVVFKRGSVWMINCNPVLADAVTGNIANFPVTTVSKNIGCIAGRSAAQVGPDIFFLSDSGVRSVARTLASEQQNFLGPPLSEPIQDIIERINQAAIATAVGCYWNNRYLLSVPLDSSTTPNYVLVYNTLTQSWSGYWTGWNATAFTRRVDSSRSKLCIGATDGSVSDFLDFVDLSNEVDVDFEDQEVDVPTTIISRGFTCGDEDSPKTGLFVRMEFNNSVTDVAVYAIIDGADPVLIDTVETSAEDVSLPIDLPFDLASGGLYPRSLDLQQFGQWRTLQIKLASTSGKLSLNSLSVGAFMDTLIVQQ